MTEANLGPLSPTERDMFTRAAGAPMDVIQGDVKTYIDTMIELKLRGGSTQWQPPVGSQMILQKDYTAETAECTYEDEYGVVWLFCNGAAVSQTTYADLYEFYGANAFGTDSGGNFLLPDARGRSVWLCGTHTAADLGDNDGVAVADRQPKHTHSDNLSMASHTHGPGSLQINAASATHTHTVPQGNTSTPVGTADVESAAPTLTVASGTHHHTFGPSVTGAPSATTTGVTGNTDTQSASGIDGSVGSGMAGSDAVAHIFLGSLFVRAL